MKNKSEQPAICEHCNLVHEGYDFYKFPHVKEILRQLQKRYQGLPQDEQLYRMENWAVKRGLRRNQTITIVDGQKKPEGGSVVMCGYGKLVEADIWLRKLEEQERELKKPDSIVHDLPF